MISDVDLNLSCELTCERIGGDVEAVNRCIVRHLTRAANGSLAGRDLLRLPSLSQEQRGHFIAELDTLRLVPRWDWTTLNPLLTPRRDFA